RITCTAGNRTLVQLPPPPRVWQAGDISIGPWSHGARRKSGDSAKRATPRGRVRLDPSARVRRVLSLDRRVSYKAATPVQRPRMEDSLAPRKDVAANTFGALRSAGCVAVLFVLASPACVT